MKRALFFSLCVACVGCAHAPARQPAPQEAALWQQQIADQQKAIMEKDAQLEELRRLLSAKEQELRERDVRIEKLREQLQSLGVFTGG